MNKDELQYLAVSAGRKFAENYHYDTKKIAVAAAYNIIINSDVIDGQELSMRAKYQKVCKMYLQQFQDSFRVMNVKKEFVSDLMKLRQESRKPKEKMTMNAEREKLCLQRY